MEILSRVENGIGSNFVLVKYENDFYAHGIETDITDKYGFPVNSCGTKEEVINHCKAISELCRKNIEYYKKRLKRLDSNKQDGCNLLLDHEQKELTALTEFIKILA